MGAAILGGLIGALGQLGGGALASQQQLSPGQQITTNYDPRFDVLNQAQQFGILNQLGFGNALRTVSPYEELVGRINQLPVDDKTKRRALAYLEFRNNQATGQSPGIGSEGARTTPTNSFNGESLTEENLRGSDTYNRWKLVQSRLGLTESDLQDLFAQNAAYKKQQKELSDAGLSGIQTQTVLDRARAAASSASLLGGAASLADTGRYDNPAIAELKRQDDIAQQRAQEKLGVMAAFGGINPANLFKTMTQSSLDQNARLLERALGISSALSSNLMGATGASPGDSGGTNAASIAAQQANALNQLRAGIADNKGTSLGNGVAGGLGTIGQGLTAYSAYQQQAKMNQQNNADLLKLIQAGQGSGRDYTAGLNTGR